MLCYHVTRNTQWNWKLQVQHSSVPKHVILQKWFELVLTYCHVPVLCDDFIHFKILECWELEILVCAKSKSTKNSKVELQMTWRSMGPTPDQNNLRNFTDTLRKLWGCCYGFMTWLNRIFRTGPQTKSPSNASVHQARMQMMSRVARMLAVPSSATSRNFLGYVKDCSHHSTQLDWNWCFILYFCCVSYTMLCNVA